MILFFVEVFNIVRPSKRAKFHLGNSCSNELASLRIAFFTAFLWHKNIFSHIDLLQEDLNGDNRQPSNGLKFNRQPSKKDIFTVKRLKCVVILTAKAFKGISNLTISADFHELLAPEKSLNWINLGPYCQKQSLWTLQDLTTCLHVKVFWNYVSKRPRQPPNTTVNVNSSSFGPSFH